MMDYPNTGQKTPAANKDTPFQSILSEAGTERLLVTIGLVILFISGIFILNQPF